MNDVITKGSSTSTGGKVITGSSSVKVNGEAIALIGDIATCACGSKSCRGQGAIVQTSPRHAHVNGQAFAKAGDLVDTGCGSCTLLPSRHQVALGSSMPQSLNIGSGVNIGNGVNINLGGAAASTSASAPENHSSRSAAQSTALVADEAPQSNERIVYIDPMKMHWPLPPDHKLPKNINIRYTQDTVEIAVLAPEEWEEFFKALDDARNIKALATGSYDAVDTAKRLGGYGVQAYVKRYNGVDYLILKGYKKHLKTLLAGNRFRASNPQVVKLGLGALDSVKGMARYIKISAPVEMAVSSAANIAQFILNDEYLLRDLGIDEAKILVNALIVAGVSLVAGVFVTSSVLAMGLTLVVSNFSIWLIDRTFDFEKMLINKVLDI